MKHIKQYENIIPKIGDYAIIQIDDQEKTVALIEIKNIHEPVYIHLKKETPVDMKYHYEYKYEIKNLKNKYTYTSTLEWLSKKIIKKSNNIEELINLLPIIKDTNKYNI